MLCFSGDFSGSVYENMIYFQQLCFFSSVFLCVFFFFLSCRFKGMQGTVRSGLITVLKTVRSDRGSHGSLHLSSRTVLDAKRTAKMSGSRFFRSDRTVRSGFHNHACESWVNIRNIFPLIFVWMKNLCKDNFFFLVFFNVWYW